MDWKDFWKSVSEWNKIGLKDKLFPNYVFNKKVFWICLVMMLVLSLLIMNNNKWDFNNKFYYHCPENGVMCENPFYNDSSVFYSNNVVCPVDDVAFCSQEFFMPGFTYGTPISEDVKMFPLYVLLIFFVGFIVNNFLFNKKMKVNK